MKSKVIYYATILGVFLFFILSISNNYIYEFPSRIDAKGASSVEEYNLEDSDEEDEETLIEASNISDKTIILIDPGHQSKDDLSREPRAPGSDLTSVKADYGTVGTTTRIPEYVYNLEQSFLLKEELEKRGYKVYMTRTSHDVNISSKKRALMAEEFNADLVISVHADGHHDNTVSGSSTLYLSNTPFVSEELANESRLLSQIVVDELSSAIDSKNRGVFPRDNLAILNWSPVPITLVEVGFMTNPEEDRLLSTEEYRKKVAYGLANGIDKYFEFKDNDLDNEDYYEDEDREENNQEDKEADDDGKEI